MLDGKPKTKTEEKVLNAYYKSITKKAQVGSVSEVRRPPTTLPNQAKRELVPFLWRESGRQLEEENSQGGDKRNEMKDEPTLGTLVVELTRLKSALREKANKHKVDADLAPSQAAYHRNIGHSLAYRHAALMIAQLIASTTKPNPTGE